MLTLKERIDGLAGRVSATRVRLTVAVPPPQVVQGFLGPLQAVRDKAASKRIRKNGRVLMRFMWPPRRWICVRARERKTLTIPTAECNAAIVEYGTAKGRSVVNS